MRRLSAVGISVLPAQAVAEGQGRGGVKFPMTSPSGRTYTAKEIRDRTEWVLADRFAEIVTAKSALA